MHRVPAAAVKNISGVVGHRFCLLFEKQKLTVCPLQGQLEVLILVDKNRLRMLGDFFNFSVGNRLVGGMHERR